MTVDGSHSAPTEPNLAIDPDFTVVPATNSYAIGVRAISRDAIRAWLAGDRDKNDLPLDLAPLAAYIADNYNSQPLQRILKSVLTRWNAEVLLESPYIDQEFLEFHADFYSSSFRPYPTYCARLHFLELPTGASITLESVLRTLADGETCDQIGTRFPGLRYRGYCVLRPTQSYNVGRTAIAFDTRQAATLPHGVALRPEEIGGQPILSVAHRCSANLFNCRFELTAPEFTQQDPNLGVCSTASLWVTSKAMAFNHGLNRFSYPTITRQATVGPSTQLQAPAVYHPAYTEQGLTSQEIKTAIAFTGAGSLYQPIQIDSSRSPTKWPIARHEIASLTESGFPVILLSTPTAHNSYDEGHAVATVGCLIPSKPHAYVRRESMRFFRAVDFKGERGFEHILTSLAIQVLYVHDDSYGPYNRVVLRDRRMGLPFVGLGGSTQHRIFLREAVAPVPPIIRVHSQGCLATAAAHFEKVAKFCEIDETSFSWRCLLVSGSQFKASLPSRNYSKSVIAFYAGLHLPKYIWLCELSTGDLSDAITGARPTVIGEFLFDPTVERSAADLVSFRVLARAWSKREAQELALRPDRICDRPEPTTSMIVSLRETSGG